ncbi:MAG: NAD(P)-binding domain-containing protein [Planctomycetes bacterium]|nr:NAD(P)-binding domain-containing protein [Planctomycetota bacterium]
MPWLFWTLPLGLLTFALAAVLRRRAELRHFKNSLAERSLARSRGSHQARLQHPAIDLSSCIGCGACVRACPEEGVLGVAYGQAMVVHGARCVGHGRCAEACPTGAISLTLGDLQGRNDLPAIDERLQAVGVPGLFLAGEITGFALVRTAVQHGVQVAAEVARRLVAAPAAPYANTARRPRVAVHSAGGGTAGSLAAAAEPATATTPLDLLIVGMGPAGLACALSARERGLQFLAIDQAAGVGGTVAAYPRRKLVMTQPMELPLHGRLTQTSFRKEELVTLWERLAQEHELPVRTGIAVTGIDRDPTSGVFTVHSTGQTFRVRNVCLALGRRGSPRRLGIPGEDLPHVAHALLDAESYQRRTILIVGGGDSAVEAALALAEQGTNTVTLSYRKGAFSRLKARNEQRIAAAMAAKAVHVLFDSEPLAITADTVTLRVTAEAAHGTIELPIDDVFVFAGGTPPFPLLQTAGVSFDPALRPQAVPGTDRGTGLLVALALTLTGLLGLVAIRWYWREYYDLTADQRTFAAAHELLRPQGPPGLWAALAATTLFAINLVYLIRRAPRLGGWLPGSLRSWMALHIASGLGALLCAWLHAGFHIRDSVGGHALLVMAIVVGAGVVGRWFYAFVPRAQNGRQQDLEELGARVTALASEWDRHGRGFGAEVRAHVENLVAGESLGRGFFARVIALVRGQARLRRQLRSLRARGLAEDVPQSEITRVLGLAQQAHRLALQVTHHEELRALLATWRYLHRWLALLLLLLTIAHIVTATRFGSVDLGRLFGGGDR